MPAGRCGAAGWGGGRGQVRGRALPRGPGTRGHRDAGTVGTQGRGDAGTVGRPAAMHRPRGGLQRLGAGLGIARPGRRHAHRAWTGSRPAGQSTRDTRAGLSRGRGAAAQRAWASLSPTLAHLSARSSSFSVRSWDLQGPRSALPIFSKLLVGDKTPCCACRGGSQAGCAPFSTA